MEIEGESLDDILMSLYRTLRYRVPAMYPFRYVTAEGGLMSYGVDVADQYRHAAEYVDRFLKGAKAARASGAGPHQIRTGDQPQARQGARL